ncbi:MAG: hypothetical protein KDA41_21955, partial [Planctomycetales bacterium]|nr:hypothetical protein [Planctomycetales bacterium]
MTSLLSSIVQAQSSPTSLAAELGWVRFRLAAGRLQFVNSQFGANKSHETGNPLVGDSESFSLFAEGAAPSLRYAHNTAEARLAINFQSPDAMSIEFQPLAPSAGPAFQFVQTSVGASVLTVDSPRGQTVYRGDSFWHMMLLHPEPMRRFVTPALTALRPQWPLEETADAMEDALVDAALSGVASNREHWRKLVEQLGSARFQERVAAERALREAGPAVAAYLQTLNLASLDAERRSRVTRLLDAVASSSDDTPQRIAIWLKDDPHIWLAVLA